MCPRTSFQYGPATLFGKADGFADVLVLMLGHFRVNLSIGWLLLL
jgi:hypothetical protein